MGRVLCGLRLINSVPSVCLRRSAAASCSLFDPTCVCLRTVRLPGEIPVVLRDRLCWQKRAAITLQWNHWMFCSSRFLLTCSRLRGRAPLCVMRGDEGSFAPRRFILDVSSGLRARLLRSLFWFFYLFFFTPKGLRKYFSESHSVHAGFTACSQCVLLGFFAKWFFEGSTKRTWNRNECDCEWKHCEVKEMDNTLYNPALLFSFRRTHIVRWLFFILDCSGEDSHSHLLINKLWENPRNVNTMLLSHCF